MRLRLLLVPFLALLSVLVVTGPSSAQYPPTTGTLTLGTSQVQAGGTVSVSGGGCVPNATVTITFLPGPVTVGTTRTDANGNFATTVTIPADATPGPHTLVATCVSASGAQRTNTAAITVLATTVTGGGNLPRTGSSSSIPLAVGGLALVGMGLMAVVAARRKRTATAATAGTAA